MHPMLLLVPAVALVLAPRLWVGHVLKKHDRHDEDFPLTAEELARALLDRNGLQQVRVEITDFSDHYDPQTRSVRLSRGKVGRRSLTALTTAAHEAAHAVQHANGYAPFVLRTRVVRLARVTGEIGTVLLLSAPVAMVISKDPLPPALIGSAALAVLGTGVVAQLAALPSELDASFGRALPMLREESLPAERISDARTILLACSLTYVASSLVAILQFLPWVRPVPVLQRAPGLTAPVMIAGALPVPAPRPGVAKRPDPRPVPLGRCRASRRRLGGAEGLVRALAKPLVRGLLRLREAP